MPEPVVTVAPDKAFLDPSKAARSLCMPRQSPKIRTLTDTPTMSVDKIVEEEEGQ